MKNLVIIGLMGSGKSAVGRLLATALGRPFLDTDQMVEAEAGRSIPELFAAEGEAGFREREARAVARAAAMAGAVIATGGGAVLRPDNREALRRTGLLFWLDAPPAVLLERAAAQGIEQRPLLAGPNPLERLTALAQSRAEAYRLAAHYRIETGGRTPEQVAALISALLDPQERK